MLEKLSQIIAETPGIASSRHAPTTIAAHLIENGVVILPQHDNLVRLFFRPGEICGTMELGGISFPVYVGEIKAEQIGRIDYPLLDGPRTSPSVVKRVYAVVEV